MCKQELGQIFLHQCSRCELLSAPGVCLDGRETQCADGPDVTNKRKVDIHRGATACLNRVDNMVRKICCDEMYGGPKPLELI